MSIKKKWVVFYRRKDDEQYKEKKFFFYKNAENFKFKYWLNHWDAITVLKRIDE